MQISTLVKRNLAHFWRTNLAVILGVATAVSVLAGALIVGDSVRASLRNLALSRLGRTDLIITAPGFFREQLVRDLRSHSQFTQNFNDLCPIIALEGVVTRDENRARAGDVKVYGVDERFWKFHDIQVQSPEGNDALVSQALASELGAKAGDTIILRIEKPSAIPAESLHGRKDDLGRTIRFSMREVLASASLGEFSIRAQQGAVRAIFVPLKKLQKNLEYDRKANAILLSAKEPDGQLSPILAKLLKDKFTLADLGLKLRTIDAQRAMSIETDGGVIGDELSDKVKREAEKMASMNLRAASILTYLANTIRYEARETPYSLVTALDEQTFLSLLGEGTYPKVENLIILNEWAARDLGVEKANLGSTITLEYYVWKQEGGLETKQAQFTIARVVPIEGIGADRNLAPDYPGITDTDSLSNWDPPFPIDLKRVREKDEDYWRKYRTTPKAFIPLSVGQKLWSSRYGKLTSIRVVQKMPITPPSEDELKGLQEFEQNLRNSLDPLTMGFSIQSVKEQSLQASRGATDFGQYFIYFSLFLVISALLLTTLFFKLGIEQRSREIGLLRAVGFSIGQIRSLFLREGFVLAMAGSALGLTGAIAYGGLMMWGLRTWWVGAVGTTELKIHITPLSLFIGSIGGIVTAIVCIWWTLRSLSPASPRSLLGGTIDGELSMVSGRPRRKFLGAARMAVVFGFLGLLLLGAAALKLIGQVGGFFGAGTLLLVAILSFWLAWLKGDKKQTISGHGVLPMTMMGFRNTSTRPGRSVLCIALVAAAAFIIVSVDAFRRDPNAQALDRQSGNGGYPLMAESLLPIVHDPNSEQGREELNLNDDILNDMKISRFRLRLGDDASCLNLYQPRNPRILGAVDEFIKSGRFSFQSSLATTDEQRTNPWLLLDQNIHEDSTEQSVIPVIADANSMTYVLHLGLGDEVTVSASNGTPVRLRLVAALADSIFQGELIMSESNFLRNFSDQEGYRVFLIETAPEKAPTVATTLEEKLSDFGFDAIRTQEKLLRFHQVENTYLSTFQTLGGLGLLLGTIGLAAVLLRNVLERRQQIALMRAVGYGPAHLSFIVIAENSMLLGCGLLTGVFCALLAIIPVLMARGGRLSTLSLGLLLLAVLVTGLAASVIAVRAVIRSPLIPALRSE